MADTEAAGATTKPRMPRANRGPRAALAALGALAALLAAAPVITATAWAQTGMPPSGGYGAPGGEDEHEDKPAEDKRPVEVPDAPVAAPTLAPVDPGTITDSIYAVVNGEVVTQRDIDNRARLFALSAGLAPSPEVMARLRGQIGGELINDRLRLQEIQRRKIVVPDIDVANAIAEIEKRNGLPAGGLRARLEGQGVDFSAMISQVRAQLGWTRVLRQHLADRAKIDIADIEREEALLRAQKGQAQYRVSEIFISAEDPTRMGEARRFADTVISQLRQGAPFGIVAAEFSQSQTALQGGDLGWVRPDQLDPQVAALINAMPISAVSNPIEVAGGYSIVTVHERRTVGEDLANVLTLRQTFFAFDTKLDPAAPTEQQKSQLAKATAFAHSVHECKAMESENAAQGNHRPADPGELREDRLNANMREVLSALAINQASRPLVTPDGILVVMVCKREQRNLAEVTREDIANRLLQERVELASRQLQQDLRRRALIDQRS